MNLSIVILAAIASSCQGQRSGWGGNTGESSLYNQCMSETYQECAQFYRGNVNAIVSQCETYADQCQRASQGSGQWPQRFRCEGSSADCQVGTPRPPSGDSRPKAIAPPGANMTNYEVCLSRSFGPCNTCYDGQYELKDQYCWPYFQICVDVSYGKQPMPSPFSCLR
ncbi:hypothetical protein MIR68_011629 [Amoeboaphelidium protococcarum]|nr:hypothetical protein MIR68_011629 [Amoeboaphelidium protococcarum]KAI3645728.1 hypothetical protein MP228_008656 [Amoeboaphelidium protococcarum]